MNSSNATALPPARRSLPGPFHGPTPTSTAETAWPRSDERTSCRWLPRWRRRSSQFAQQMRSNSAPRTRTNHHAPALLPCCDGLLREGSWWGSLDGLQGLRGSYLLSSTTPARVRCARCVPAASTGVTGWQRSCTSAGQRVSQDMIPLKAVAPVRIRSGLPSTSSATRPVTCTNEGRRPCCVSDWVGSVSPRPLPARLPRPDHRPTPPPWPTARTRHGAGRGGRRGTGGGAGQCTRAWLSSSERPRCRPSMIDQNREQFMGSLAGHCRPCSSAVRATSIRCCCSASSANL